MITTSPSTMMIRVFVGNFFGPVYPIAIPYVLKSGFKAFSIVPCETHHMAVDRVNTMGCNCAVKGVTTL
jgi:hypothetical protein